MAVSRVGLLVAARTDRRRSRARASTPRATAFRRCAAAIELRDVRVAYDGAAMLDGASLVVPVGQLTVVIGPSGAGKTTVADLVIGLMPARGRRGADRRRAARRARPAALAGADRLRAAGDLPAARQCRPQRHPRRPDLSPADAEAALRLAGAWDFVAALPEGTDTHGRRARAAPLGRPAPAPRPGAGAGAAPSSCWCSTRRRPRSTRPPRPRSAARWRVCAAA